MNFVSDERYIAFTNMTTSASYRCHALTGRGTMCSISCTVSIEVSLEMMLLPGTLMGWELLHVSSRDHAGGNLDMKKRIPDIPIVGACSMDSSTLASRPFVF